MGQRLQVITKLAELIIAVDSSHPMRVAIDGVDASGKTTLADELIPLIEDFGRTVIRASIDGFHNPREVRYQQGVDSPEGYYHDSFNYQAILQDLLIPLGPGGNRKYRLAVFDYRANTALINSFCEAPIDAILLFDGVFLLRPELIQYWDFSIFVDVDFEVSVPRAVSRDVVHSVGKLTPQMALAKYNQRYVPGQKIYLNEAHPKDIVNVVVNNNDLENPKMIISE